MLRPARRRRVIPCRLKEDNARSPPPAVFNARVYSAASAGGNWLFSFVV
jgi:hypothetical protein